MTATLMTHVKPRPAHRGPRSAGRGQAASCAGDPALGDQSRERTEESTGEKSQSGPRLAGSVLRGNLPASLRRRSSMTWRPG